jgi:hypothetical protein
MKPGPVKGLRQYARVPFAAEVLLHVQDQTLKVQLIDIALKGALVQVDTSEKLALHTPCRLELPLADDGDGVVMSGAIVHLEGQHVGIECRNIDLTSLTRLRRLIELNTGDPDLMDRELSHLFG